MSIVIRNHQHKARAAADRK